MSNIDRVDVLNSATSATIFGMRGSKGVIAIYTKMGEAIYPDNEYVRGAITESIIGFSSTKEFYSPKYSPENIADPKPDHRTTLYWNPNVKLVDGVANLEFYSSDDIGRYKIIVEGLTPDGEICIGTGELDVDSMNENRLGKL